MEQTGHYHRALEQYLLELDVAVFRIHVQRRPAGLVKTDKRDALALANQLFNQLEKGVQVGDPAQHVRRALPPTEAAALLAALVRHRYELSRERIQRMNKLTALCDELFPDPLTPVITTSRLRGMSTSTFCKLCVRAPRTEIMESIRPRLHLTRKMTRVQTYQPIRCDATGRA